MEKKLIFDLDLERGTKEELGRAEGQVGLGKADHPVTE